LFCSLFCLLPILRKRREGTLNLEDGSDEGSTLS
jgi:hypothetical protein